MSDPTRDFDASSATDEEVEATGKELRHTLEAWQLLPWLERKENISVCDPTPPQTDKLSATLKERSSFDSTYAAKFRVKSDHDIPSKVLEAVQHEHIPQFTLRNIGRAEHSIDLEDPLPLERKAGIGHSDYGLLDEVRNARLPKPEMAQVWSVAYSQRVRAQFRRLLLEDPWEVKYGAEVKANHSGPMHSFVIEGTHPDDVPGADWGPETMQPPDDWQGRSIDDAENVATFHDIRTKITSVKD